MGGRNKYSASIITWQRDCISSHLGRLLNLNVAVITALARRRLLQLGRPGQFSSPARRQGVVVRRRSNQPSRWPS